MILTSRFDSAIQVLPSDIGEYLSSFVSAVLVVVFISIFILYFIMFFFIIVNSFVRKKVYVLILLRLISAEIRIFESRARKMLQMTQNEFRK